MPRVKNTAANMAAVIYARFSSHNQREESIEQQVAECKAYAAANGYDIVGIYADSARSGRSDRRPQFQKLRRDAEKGGFATIIAYKSNRIARNMLNAMMFETEVERYGIKVLYAKEEFGNNAAGRFALRTMMNVNQFFSENMGEDIKRNQADNALNCRANGPASYGYMRGEDGRFVIDEETAPIVQEIFTLVACGQPFCDIADTLNNRGIRTRRGGLWKKSSFANILNNERYIGVYIFDDVRIEGGMPEIISKELFYKVQNILKNKKNPQGRHRESGDYLLTGKLFCGECGSHMIGMSGTSKSGSLHAYYVCNEKRSGGSCKKKNVKRDYIEEKIAEGIKKYILQDEVINWIADTVEEYQRTQDEDADLMVLEARLSEVKKLTKNLLDAIEQGIVTMTTKARLLELEDEQSSLSQKITLAKADNIYVTREQVIAWLNSFRAGDVTDKTYQADIIRAFLVKAYLYDNNKIKLFCDPYGTSDKFIEIPIDASGNAEDNCSFKAEFGSPKRKKHHLRGAFLFFDIPTIEPTQIPQKFEQFAL